MGICGLNRRSELVPASSPPRQYIGEADRLGWRIIEVDVQERDRLRIERLNEADSKGFWDLVQENRDDLKWCGSAPIYTFLKALPQARGTLRRYQQWNIDEHSVVSFAGIAFR